MPARGSYQVTSRKEGEVAEQDQSYRSCIIALLIFFFLCMILILSTWLLGPAKTAPNTDSRNNNDRSEKLKYEGNEFKTTKEDRNNTATEFEPDFDKQKDDKNVSPTEHPQKRNTDPELTGPIQQTTTPKSDNTDSITKSDTTMISSTIENYTNKIMSEDQTKHTQTVIQGLVTTTTTTNPHNIDDSIIGNDTTMISPTNKDYTYEITSEDQTKHTQGLIQNSSTTTATPNPHNIDDSMMDNDTTMTSLTTEDYTYEIISEDQTKHTQALIQDSITETTTPNLYNTDDSMIENDTTMISPTNKDYTYEITSEDQTKHTQGLIQNSSTTTATPNPHNIDDSMMDNDTTMTSLTTEDYTYEIISEDQTKHTQALIQDSITETTTPNLYNTDDSMIENDTTMISPTIEDYTNEIISEGQTKYTQGLIQNSSTTTASPNPHNTDDSMMDNDTTMISPTIEDYTNEIMSKDQTKYTQGLIQDSITKTTTPNPHKTDDSIIKNDTMTNPTTEDYANKIISKYPTKHRQALTQDSTTRTTTPNPYKTDGSMIENDTTMISPTIEDYTNEIISEDQTKYTQGLIQDSITRTTTPNPYKTDDSIIENDTTMISPTTEDHANKIMSKDHTEDKFQGSRDLKENKTSTLGTTTTAKPTIMTETKSTQSNISDWYTEQSTTISNDNDSSQTTNGFNSSATIIDSSDANVPVTTTTKQSIWDNVSSNIIDKDEQNGQCATFSCKKLASKMFLYMNPSADACDDFYEYACGGLENDSEIFEKNLLNRAYHRIESEMRKGKNMESRLFLKYYDSCVKYDEAIERSERTKMVIDVLKSIGKFYTSANQNDDDPDITDLFRKLFIHNSALLFDIVPDVDEFASNRFTLKIGPPFPKSSFILEDPDDPCNPRQKTLHGDYFDVNNVYEMYIDCKKGKEPIVDSIKESITIMVSDMSIENVPQFIDSIVHDIDIELIQGFLMLYPSDDEAREAYVSKNYSMMTLETLETTNDVINWTALISSLTNNNNARDMQLQVYFENQLIKGMQNLKDFAIRRGLKALNNALLGLYARNLYQELIAPKPRHSKRQCLREASSRMEFEASSLYMSSFSKEEIERMNTTIIEMFHELKFTLKLNFEDAEWLNDAAKEELLRKLEQMTVIIPNILHYEHSRGLRPNLTDNYFKNTISLMKNYRSRMYNERMYQNPRDPQAIWMNFAVPFQTQAVTIYGLNTVIIPFGVIDWTILPKGSEILKSFDFLLFATLGNVIAHEISHHFDSTGMYYDGNKRDMEYMIINEDGSSVITFDIYTSCHKMSYPDPINLMVRSLNHTAKFKVSELSLNERLSDIMGLRLVYDTLSRISWANQVPLPWLNLNVKQLFYLAFAQSHCTKLPLTSFYSPDYHIPSRVRIFVSASSEPLLGNAWSCMPGTNVVPADTCPVFPKLVNDAKSEVLME